MLLLAALLPACMAEARAHAALLSSDPADGSIVSEAPRYMHLVFNEPVSPSVLRLVDPSGRSLALDRFELHDGSIVIEAPGNLSSGSYALSWRVTSADGHPIGGSIAFSIGAVSGKAAQGEADGEKATGRLIWTARLAFYLGLFFGAGALSFHAFVAPAPPQARRFSLAMLGLGLIAVPPSLALQGLDLLGASLAGLASADTYVVAISSAYALTLLIGGAAMLTALAGWFAPPGASCRVLAALALGGVGAALAASGHASTADPRWLMRPAVFLHGVCVAFWAGSLVPFALVLRGGGAGAKAMLARFSAAILPAVAILVAAGAVLGFVQMRRVEALWTTAYGQVFLAKLGLLGLLFTLAAINRFVLTPAAAASKPKTAQQFARSARWETVLVCAILAVVALWRFTPPPRILAAAQAAPASIHIHDGHAMVEVVITPGQAGPVAVSIRVMGGDFVALEPKGVSLSASNAQAGVEPLRRRAERIAPGLWSVDNIVLTPPGEWSIKVELLVSDFEKQVLDGKMKVR